MQEHSITSFAQGGTGRAGGAQREGRDVAPLAAEIKALAERARKDKLTEKEMSGGCRASDSGLRGYLY